ncbi:Type 3 secretion system ATPase (T3SS ATPase) [Durusdinium trenchii]|uniref:Type 3 secretion system ATPase (T3SS ATPase) n=1 Tax=Durusdinium trenchii TaxID=1381693 RepID=A0ABP0LV00_9DINO
MWRLLPARRGWRLRHSGHALRFAARRFAAHADIAASETTTSLLNQIQGSLRLNGSVWRQGTGTLQSSTGGLLRLTMQGDVSVGIGETPAVVVRFDKTGVVAAALSSDVDIGDQVTSCGTLALQSRTWPTTPVVTSLSELVSPAGKPEESLLKLPAQQVSKRLPISRHCPSGLAPVEALLPLGEGQRVGLASWVGPAGAGKSTALRMLVAAQAPSTAVVLVAHRSRARLEPPGVWSELCHLTDRQAPLLALAAEPFAPAPERYFLLLAALRLAVDLSNVHSHVLLCVDDAVGFAEAAQELGVPPLSAPQVIASTLEAAGCGTTPCAAGGVPRAMTVAMALDVSPEDDLALVPRELWRSAEPSLDVCLKFSHQLASKGVFPAIDLDVLNVTFGPTYQPAVLRQLRHELQRLLQRSARLREKLGHGTEATGRDLGFQAELEEVDTLGSDTVARSLLAQQHVPKSLREVVVLTCASVVFYFPHQKPSSCPAAFVCHAECPNNYNIAHLWWYLCCFLCNK